MRKTALRHQGVAPAGCGAGGAARESVTGEVDIADAVAVAALVHVDEPTGIVLIGNHRRARAEPRLSVRCSAARAVRPATVTKVAHVEHLLPARSRTRAGRHGAVIDALGEIVELSIARANCAPVRMEPDVFPHRRLHRVANRERVLTALTPERSSAASRAARAAAASGWTASSSLHSPAAVTPARAPNTRRSGDAVAAETVGAVHAARILAATSSPGIAVRQRSSIATPPCGSARSASLRPARASGRNRLRRTGAPIAGERLGDEIGAEMRPRRCTRRRRRAGP